MAIDAGSPAPDFTLPGTSSAGQGDFTLSAERGHPVVIAFYPGDDTPVCTRQLCSYQDDLSLLTGLDAVLWGISTQDIASHERFAAKRGLSFPLLADVDGAVHKAYGLGSILNRRAVFVVDGTGRIAHAAVSRTGLTYEGADEIAAAIRALDAYPGGSSARSDSAAPLNES